MALSQKTLLKVTPVVTREPSDFQKAMAKSTEVFNRAIKKVEDKVASMPNRVNGGLTMVGAIRSTFKNK